MAERKDIVDGIKAEEGERGIVYTKKCGWIDLGHAIPRGARELWRTIKFEKGFHAYTITGSSLNEAAFRGKHGYIINAKMPFHINLKKDEDFFIISYHQTMRAGVLSKSVGGYFKIKKGLSMKLKKAIALSIFLKVSFKFEAYQGNWAMRLLTDSCFSGEDLVSNLISFYRAVEPGKSYIKMSEPVSLKEALAIWDKFKPIGQYKNRKPEPLLFHTKAKTPVRGRLPLYLNTIKSAKPGVLFQ